MVVAAGFYNMSTGVPEAEVPCLLVSWSNLFLGTQDNESHDLKKIVVDSN